MALSPYTIDVAPCQPDGSREIFLQHHQRPCFSTTHREVLRVCLAKWPTKPSVEEAAHATDLDSAEAVRTHHTEEAYRTLLDGTGDAGAGYWANAKEAARPSQGTGAKASDSSRQKEEIPILEDYLCVFHREELADQHGRYTFVQPQTICTAYRVRDAAFLEVVLHGLSPRDIAAASSTGSGGVFLHGRRQPSRGGGGGGGGGGGASSGWGNALEHQGLLYKPAADAWWMGSPLSVKPVYVAVGPVASPPATAEGNRMPSARVFPAEPPRTEEAGAACVVVADAPLTVGNESQAECPCSSPPQGSPLSNIDAAAPVEGRTAQGQYDFPRSRSSSPLMHSPLPPLSSPAAAAVAASNNTTDTIAQTCGGETKGTPPPPAPHTQMTPTLVSSKSKFVSLDASLLTQLPLYDAESAAVLPRSLAVVRTGPDTLGLAVTTPLYALDAMLWQGWPHRVRFSRLASSTSALSVVASPHPSTPRYLLFLYDAHYSRLRVVRTPDVHTGAGDLELLVSFACGDLPFVLPCLHADHPSPIAVCNFPHANCISVYDVVALQEQPSADAAVVRMDVGAHQAAHPQCFGEVRLTGEAAACHADVGLPLDPQSIKKPRHAADAPEEDKGSVQNKWRRQACEAKTWAADAATSSLSHPIRGLLYHYAACLVLQYDWPGGAARDGDAEAAHVVSESGRVGDGGHNSNSSRIRLGGGRRRRRCEGTVSYSVHFPSLSADTQPLVVFMLEALGAALGPRAVAHVEYELFTEAWRCSCTADASANALETCTALIRRLFMPPALLPAQSVQAGRTDEEEEGFVPHFAVADACMFVDPSMLTIQGIRQALHASEAVATVKKSVSSYMEKSNGRASVLSWTSQQAGLALVALHLLYEGCRLQEPLWELLPPLAALNSSLSAHLQWPSYMEYYSAVAPVEVSSRADPETTQPSTSAQCFRECLSPEVVADHFEFLQPHPPVPDSTPSLPPQLCGSGMMRFADGEAPELFRTLSLLAMGSGGAATHTSAIYNSWPLLRRVPDAHPIALANRLVLVYHEVFCSPAEFATGADSSGNADSDVGRDVRWWERVCAQLLQHNISSRLVRQVLNTGVAYPLLEALTKGREQAAPDWPATLLDLVGRRDQCPPTSRAAQLISAGRHVVEAAEENAVARQICATMSEDDGVSVRPDFRQTWRDARLDVAQNLFNTVAPISLAGYEDRPEELTGALELLSCRARAMPLGRGMLTMCTQSFKVQDSIPIPPLNLNGRTNDGIAITNKATEDLMWPLFHNGCAAGLRFLPLPPTFGVVGGAVAADGIFAAAAGNIEGDGLHAAPQSADSGSAAAAAAQSITKQWVMYQTKNIGNAASRAGLLLATGILGHLTVLQRTDIFYLLISRQEQYVWREATTMAVMLGLSCSFCGTSSEAVFRCLSVHVQSLNPSAEDIEVSLDVQTAALVSMGLLCQQAPSNTFLVEVFLVEISRLPTDEHCSKREGYVLGAGFGLGQLLLGVGAAHGVAHVEDRLLAFMNGAPRRSAVSTREGVASFEETMGRGEAGHFLARALLSQEQREATFNSCASVYEGDCYNIFVSGPAAVVALGMIYLQTDSVFIAAKVAPPNRRTAMQRLTPLLCHLRSTMSSLICWSNIVPTREWLYGQLPSSLLELTASASTAAGSGTSLRIAAQQRNYLLMNLAHCIAGQVMALGLRYAGTMETQARDVILAEMQGFLAGRIGSTAAVIPAVQRVTGAYETCVLTCANALSLVMAGTGDLKVFGVLQHLHRRTNVSYGSHMAISMSMGLLFLGSGRLSLSNSISSVAALLMAFYPLWPSDGEDNTHHLQALRQLYGLAVVPRVMEAVDAVSHQPVSVPVRIVLLRACLEGGGGDGRGGGDGAADEESGTVGAAKTATVNEQQRNAATCAAAQAGKPREIRTRTPCLYPPAEMIDRVEILSPRHYPLTFTPASSELQRSATMEFRVMAKDGLLGHGDSLMTRSPLELRLLDWLHRLFHQPSTTAAEALAMQDGVRLMLGVQRRLVATALAGEVLLSGDFGASVKSAMEERYGYIFSHGGSDQRAAASTRVQRHPLYMLIMEGASCDAVVRSIAAHPKGTAAFPCDFTALLYPVSAPLRRAPSCGANEEAAAMAEEEEQEEGGLDAVDLVALRRWIVESLHYYGLKPSVQQSIREAFIGLGVGTLMPVPAARLLCLLRLQCATQLPLSTLENVWACCVR